MRLLFRLKTLCFVNGRLSSVSNRINIQLGSFECLKKTGNEEKNSGSPALCKIDERQRQTTGIFTQQEAEV